MRTSMKALIVIAVACAQVACSMAKSPNELPAEGWGVDDYTKAGMPAVDHPWTVDELKTAHEVLAKETVGHRERLPHRSGARSGPVFARIVEPPSLPADPNQAYGAHAERFDVLNQISKLYTTSEMAAGSVEFYAITGSLLQEAQALEVGADAFLALFAADDPTLPTRQAGFVKMRSGYSTMLLGGLMMVSDVRAPESARIGLSRDLAAVLPTMYPHAEPGTKQLIKDQLGRMHDLFKDGALKDALPPRL